MSDITLLGFDPAGIGREKAMSENKEMRADFRVQAEEFYKDWISKNSAAAGPERDLDLLTDFAEMVCLSLAAAIRKRGITYAH